MTDYITTRSGLHFVPTRPDANRILITDIAHALSLICRGNGHVKTFFSVGQHCVNCALEAAARGCTARVVLACLLHDAGEAYLSDVPGPLKRQMEQFRKWEDALLDVIYVKFLGSVLTEEEAAVVKGIDEDMLYFDLKYLLNEVPDGPKPVMRSGFSYRVCDFASVEKRYLELFEAFTRVGLREE